MKILIYVFAVFSSLSAFAMEEREVKLEHIATGFTNRIYVEGVIAAGANEEAQDILNGILSSTKSSTFTCLAKASPAIIGVGAATSFVLIYSIRDCKP
jgi:hypothetical protein